MGYNPLYVSEEQFTTSSVISELRHNTPHIRLRLALETGKIKVHAPSVRSLEEVEEVSRRVGDVKVISEADKDILAVALDLSRSDFSPMLVSDDYTVQNVAEFLGLKYVSLTTFGIRYQFRWTLHCPACKRIYEPDVKKPICIICGTPLKRKVLRKKTVRRDGKGRSFNI